jgi:hypothetical protein
MSDQIVDEIQFDNTPGGGSTTETFQADITTDGSLDDNPDTVTVLEGFDRRRGFQKEPSFQILGPGAFSALSPLMTSRNDVEVTITWNGGSDTVVSGLKANVLPVTAVRPDFKSVWYDTDTGASDTPSTDSDGSWTELSEPLGNFSEDHDIITRENARGLPFYIAGLLDVTVPMFYNQTALSNLRTEDNNNSEIRLAIETQAGNYLIFGDQSGGGVEVEVRQMPSPASDEVNHFVANVFQTGDFDSMITYPSGASDLFFGAQVDMFSFAQNEGDILTENR